MNASRLVKATAVSALAAFLAVPAADTGSVPAPTPTATTSAPGVAPASVTRGG
ncbi:hypothetical protein ACIQF6_24795 [Kitasatospora sp. NPDC092948]|uniref:hypothetical protein n=1 Tax=Kitasatospora sp. NPDC092948 TaxID=3364088 RepID=UPI0037F2750D